MVANEQRNGDKLTPIERARGWKILRRKNIPGEKARIFFKSEMSETSILYGSVAADMNFSSHFF